MAPVATSGNYNDLTNTPTIPPVNDATLTIKQNNETLGTFTANASENQTINLTDTTYDDFGHSTTETAGTAGLVPAPAADTTNQYLNAAAGWQQISYAQISDAPQIPVVGNGALKVSLGGEAATLTGFTANSSSDATISIPVMTAATSSAGGTIGLVPASTAGDQNKVLSAGATWVELPTVPTNVSEFTNDANYITAAAVGNGTLTIQRESGTNNNSPTYETLDDGTFTANATTNRTVKIPVMIGAHTRPSDQNGETGLVPKPTADDKGKFLRADATWQPISYSDLTNAPTVNNAELKIYRESGVDANNNPTYAQLDDNNGTFTANASTNKDIHIPVMIGTDGNTNGETGLVPEPTANDKGKFLCSDATWKEVPCGCKSDIQNLQEQLDKVNENYTTLQNNFAGIKIYCATTGTYAGYLMYDNPATGQIGISTGAKCCTDCTVPKNGCIEENKQYCCYINDVKQSCSENKNDCIKACAVE